MNAPRIILPAVFLGRLRARDSIGLPALRTTSLRARVHVTRPSPGHFSDVLYACCLADDAGAQLKEGAIRSQEENAELFGCRHVPMYYVHAWDKETEVVPGRIATLVKVACGPRLK